MNLKTLISEDGIPEIHIGFDQDTSDSEPYMVLKAHGMSLDEVAGTLMDVAQSLHNNIPVEEVKTYEVYPERQIGRPTPDGEALLSQMADMRRPGETVRDVERRLIAQGRLVGGKIVDPPADDKPRHVPFNPQPRGAQR